MDKALRKAVDGSAMRAHGVRRLGRFRIILVISLVSIGSVVAVRDELKNALRGELIRIRAVPAGRIDSFIQRKNVIYVLGGSGNSLERRFEVAADLYRQGLSHEVLVMSRPGITSYDPIVGRNLTNDEWSINKLVELGVTKSDIRFTNIEQGVFGTLRESKQIADLVVAGGYRSLILVSSSYHTRRVWLCFEKWVRGRNVELYVYRSNEPDRLIVLLLEYAKLFFYRAALL